MTKQQAVQMGDEVMEAVKLIAEKYGMDVKRGSGRYGDSEYKLNNITFYEKGDTNSKYSSTDEDLMGRMYESMKYRHEQLVDTNAGDVYYSSRNNMEMKIVGWKTRNRKYPILVQEVKSGKLFKMAPSALISDMGK